MSMRPKPLIGAKVRAVRHALKLTQQQTADRSNGLLERSYVAQIESGPNQGRSYQVRMGLATAFNLRLSDLQEYLEGRFTLKQLLRRSASPQEPSSPPPTAAILYPKTKERRMQTNTEEDRDLFASETVRDFTSKVIREHGPIQIRLGSWTVCGNRYYILYVFNRGEIDCFELASSGCFLGSKSIATEIATTLLSCFRKPKKPIERNITP